MGFKNNIRGAGPGGNASGSKQSTSPLERLRFPASGVLLLVGSIGFASCLWMIFGSMTDVITNNGGMCASGGPYVIDAQHQCSSGTTVLMAVGGPGLFVFGALALTGAIGVLGSRGVAHLLLMGSCVFGLLGWNFLHTNPAGHGTDSGMIVCGVMFLVMAAGGLIGLVPIVGLWRWRWKSDVGQDTKYPVTARKRRVMYWGMFAAGMTSGVLIGRAIVAAAL